MRYLLYVLLLVSTSLSGQATDSLRFRIDQERGAPGDTVRVCFAADGFRDIISMQFTLRWDTSVLSYVSLEPGELPGLSAASVAEPLAISGAMPLVWFDGQGDGVNLADGTQLFCLIFRVVGDPGDQSPVGITGDPVPVQIGRLNGSAIESITLGIQTGQVEVVDLGLATTVMTSGNTCFGDQAGTISVTTTGGQEPYQYKWTGPDGFTGAGPALSDLMRGQYILEVSDADGRSALDTILVAGPDAPLTWTLATSSPTLCGQSTGSIRLELSGGTAPYQYDFGMGFDTTATQSALGAGLYMIMGRDGQGCLADTTIEVSTQQEAEPVSLGEDRTLCLGDSVVLSVPLSYSDVRWRRDGVRVPGQANELRVRNPGIYEVEARTSNGCLATGTIRISLSTAGGAASGDGTIEVGDSLQLMASAGSDYLWSPGLGLSCTQCPDPVASPDSTTIYLVQFRNQDGCRVIDTVRVRVNDPEEMFRFEPITLITPNGDGLNDELYFDGLETYMANEIKIFNRWGQTVFSRVDYQLRGDLWDGTFRGQPLPAGVYYYILRVNEDDLFIKQALTLVRE